MSHHDQIADTLGVDVGDAVTLHTELNQYDKREIIDVLAANAGSGGGGSLPTGAGSPVGAVTPSGVGALYVDTTNGGLYIASGATSADWVVVGGIKVGSIGDVPGVHESGSILYLIGGTDRDVPFDGPIVWLTEAYAQWNGNGEGLSLVGDGTGNVYRLHWVGNGESIDIINDSNTLQAPSGGLFLPSVDPEIPGAWWDNAGVLTKSTGPPP